MTGTTLIIFHVFQVLWESCTLHYIYHAQDHHDCLLFDASMGDVKNPNIYV